MSFLYGFKKIKFVAKVIQTGDLFLELDLLMDLGSWEGGGNRDSTHFLAVPGFPLPADRGVKLLFK